MLGRAIFLITIGHRSVALGIENDSICREICLGSHGNDLCCITNQELKRRTDSVFELTMLFHNVDCLEGRGSFGDAGGGHTEGGYELS